jgi:hypothetical protein
MELYSVQLRPTPLATMSGPQPYRQGMPSTYQQVPSSSSHHGHSSSVGHGQEYYGTNGGEGYMAPPPPPLRENATQHGVQTGQIGGGFGPYAVSSLIPMSRSYDALLPSLFLTYSNIIFYSFTNQPLTNRS